MGYTVLQFGEGNFIRAFFDWMLQKIGENAGMEHRVFLVQPLPEGRVDDIVKQGEYHVLLRGYRDGEYREILDTVTVIAGGANPFTPGGRKAMVEAALSPELRVITSNTTEAGIFFEKRAEPHNYPSFLAEVLQKRAAKGLPPLLIIPLELIENNGKNLRECLEKYGKLWNYGRSFFDYLDSCTFYDTLVDRIVPGFPRKESGEIFRRIGREDFHVTAGELFHLFVLQGDRSILEVLPFHKAGLNVVLTDDRLPFFRNRKVRILNGVHTASTPVALLAGVEYVKDFVEDERFSPSLRSLVHDEIVPAFSDDADAHKYGDDVLERFRNPALEHAFRSIALNSVAKSNTRLRPTLEDYFRLFGKLPPVLTGCIAAMTKLYDCGGVKELPGGPMELSDYRQLKGRSLPEMTDSLFPGLDPDLRTALLGRLGELRQGK